MPGFDCEGLWWFSDLTKSDPLYLLPIYGTLVLAVLMSVRYFLSRLSFSAIVTFILLSLQKGIESASSEMSLSTGNRIILAVIFAGSFALFSSFQPSVQIFWFLFIGLRFYAYPLILGTFRCRQWRFIGAYRRHSRLANTFCFSAPGSVAWSD